MPIALWISVGAAALDASGRSGQAIGLSGKWRQQTLLPGGHEGRFFSALKSSGDRKERLGLCYSLWGRLLRAGRLGEGCGEERALTLQSSSRRHFRALETVRRQQGKWINLARRGCAEGCGQIRDGGGALSGLEGADRLFELDSVEEQDWRRDREREVMWSERGAEDLVPCGLWVTEKETVCPGASSGGGR